MRKCENKNKNSDIEVNHKVKKQFLNIIKIVRLSICGYKKNTGKLIKNRFFSIPKQTSHKRTKVNKK